MFSSKLFGRGFGARKLLAAAGAALALLGFGVTNAQTVTGTMAPASATPSQSVVLTLAYSGFTVQNIGYKFRVYFDSTKLTFVSTSNGAAPAGAYQGDSGVLADAANGDGAAATDSFVDLIWADFATSAWPTSSAGTLGTVSFTTAAGFNGTSVSLRESAAGAQVRNVPGSTVALPLFVPATAATFTSSPSTLTFAEGGVAQNVTVTCAGSIGTPSPVVVNVASSNTAAFTVGAPTLSFTTCPSAQTVAVTPRAADAGSNPTQTGNVTFSTATTGATAPASVAVTVTDNQSPAVYSVTTPTATVTEGNVATGTMTVSCTGAFTGGLTSGSVQYAITGLTNPGDIAAPALTGALTFAACGGATQSITISPRVNDAIVQGNKTGTFTIATPVGGTITTATGNIAVNDDDTPQTITVAVGGSPASETNGILTYTFTRAGGNAAALAAPLTVNITPVAANARYTVSAACAASTITFAGGSPTAACTVTGVPNSVVDGNVNAVITVAAPTVAGSYVVGTPSSATGVIADDDFGVSVTATIGSVVEGQPAVFNINCNGAVGNFTVVYTVTGQDAGTVATPASPATLACTTGTSRLVITVPTIDDALIGNTRSVVLTLISVTAVGAARPDVVVGTPASATTNIIDNDAPKDIPTMSPIALGLLALMMFGFAAFGQRRQRRHLD